MSRGFMVYFCFWSIFDSIFLIYASYLNLKDFVNDGIKPIQLVINIFLSKFFVIYFHHRSFSFLVIFFLRYLINWISRCQIYLKLEVNLLFQLLGFECYNFFENLLVWILLIHQINYLNPKVVGILFFFYLWDVVL